QYFPTRRSSDLTWLQRCLIQVQHNRQSGKEKQKEDDDTVLLIFAKMPIRTEQTKQQWQEKVSVAGRVLFFRCRQCILPPYQHVIYWLNARYPIAFYM